MVREHLLQEGILCFYKIFYDNLSKMVYWAIVGKVFAYSLGKEATFNLRPV